MSNCIHVVIGRSVLKFKCFVFSISYIPIQFQYRAHSIDVLTISVILFSHSHNLVK